MQERVPFLDLDWEVQEKLAMDAVQEFMPSLDLFKDWMGWMLHRRLDLIRPLARVL